MRRLWSAHVFSVSQNVPAPQSLRPKQLTPILRPKIVRISFPIQAVFAVTILTGLVLSCGKTPTAQNSQAAVGRAVPPDYSNRIGVAVRTEARTCVAIKNDTLAAGSPVTLVVPASPQSFVETQVAGRSQNACPITEDIPPGVANYEISLPKSSNIPKLTPMLAVAGTAASNGFALDNVNVEADLDQTRSTNTFRACGGSDGIYLTVWRGVPLDGTLLWTGYYYESGNPGTLPNCTAAEAKRVPPQSNSQPPL